MARTRRTYTSEFKAEAVKLVTEQGYSVAEAARSLVPSPFFTFFDRFRHLRPFHYGTTHGVYVVSAASP